MECIRMYYILVNLLLIAIGQSEAGIEYKGKVPQTVFAGDNVTFHWLYTGTDEVVWARFLADKNEELAYYPVGLKESTPKFQPNNANIVQYATTVKWAGDYSNNQYNFTLVNVTEFSHQKNFSVRLSAGVSIQNSFTVLFISVIPEVKLVVEKTNVSVGDRVTIECRTEKQGRPKVNILWYHNNILLETKGEAQYLFNQKEIELKDAGSYHCIARNAAGEDKSEVIKITVHKKNDGENSIKTPRPSAGESSGGGLGGGAIAGIVVGVLLLIVVVLLVIIFLKRRGRTPKTNKHATVNDDESKSAMVSKSEKDQVWL